MISLEIKEFSCIEFAHVELHPLTIVIGPQSSGKSLISKLLYFFNDIVSATFYKSSNTLRIKAFLKDLSANFEKSFPSNTWGGKSFLITYKAGPVEFVVQRRMIANKPSSRVSFTASSFFSELYERHFATVFAVTKKKSDDDGIFTALEDGGTWEISRNTARVLIDQLRSDFVEEQFFIPAGRSFYANLGKAVAMLEFGSRLDSVTLRFGRRFASLLDGAPLYVARERSAKIRDMMRRQNSAIEAIIGGKIKLSSTDKHIETRDGRLIPLSLMSSGQQELLPLLLTLQEYVFRNFQDNDPSTDLLYIEEPEAHLFPLTQSELIQYLVSVRNGLAHRSKMFITTHSPYVLSSINNLILAGQIASRGDVYEELVHKVVSKDRWLSADAVAAYSIENGVCKTIVDETGLINGDYLDSVSCQIGESFAQLLEIDSMSM